MNKTNIKRKTLGLSLKSLAFALGFTAATGTTSFAMPVKETKTIENHEHEHEFDSIDEVIVKMPETYSNNTEKVYQSIVIKEVKSYSITNYKGSSIVEALNLCGIDSSFSNRKVIATNYGIKNYRGTATQNILLLNNLKNDNIKSIAKVSDIEKVCKDLFGKNAYRVISDLKLPKTANLTKSEFARIIRSIANYMGVDTSTYDNRLDLVKNAINDVNVETLNNNDIAWSYYMGYTDIDEELNYNSNNFISVEELNNWIRSFTNDYNVAISNKNYNSTGIVIVPSLDKYQRDNNDLSKINDIRNPQSVNKPGGSNNNHSDNNHSDSKPVQHIHKYNGWTYYDADREVSTCNDCGSKKYQRHTLTNNIQTSYQSNNDGTHVVTKSAYCTSCHTMVNKVSTINCYLTDWNYNELTGKDERKCNDCGYEEVRTHEHNVPTNLEYNYYSSNNDGTHKLKATYECNKCHETVELYKDVDCSLSDWTYNSTTGKDERGCNTCGYTETRIHEHNVPTNLEYNYYSSNNDGTHKLKATYECNKCHETVELYKDVSCSLSDWTYNHITGKEERECNVCGYHEERVHEHDREPSNLTYRLDGPNYDGTHKLKASYTCDSCLSIITLTKNEDCEFGSWQQHDGSSCKSLCIVCSYEKFKNHNFTVVPNSITSNATLGKHNVTKECDDCDYTKEVEENCTSNGVRYYYRNGEIITEREDCSICGDVCIDAAHSHSYGTYISIDDNQHKRVCDCEHESVEAHNYSEWILNNGQNTRECGDCHNVQTVEHICSLTTNDIFPDSKSQDYCYERVTTCTIAGCTYRVVEEQVGHNYITESNAFGATHECDRCGYYYSEEFLPTTMSLRNTAPDEEKIIEEPIVEEVIEEEIIEDEVIEEEKGKVLVLK